MSVALFIVETRSQDLRNCQNSKEPTADDLSMLLANLSKSSALERLIVLERSKVVELSPSKRAITQLIELFNRGANKGWNKNATYDYLAYMFADLAKVWESPFYCQVLNSRLMHFLFSSQNSSHISPRLRRIPTLIP